MVAIAADGTIMFANEAFAILVGHSAAQLVSMRSSDVFLTITDDDHAAGILTALAGSVVEMLHGDLYVVTARLRRTTGPDAQTLYVAFD